MSKLGSKGIRIPERSTNINNIAKTGLGCSARVTRRASSQDHT
jgi:hypothetical protein